MHDIIFKIVVKCLYKYLLKWFD